MVSLLQVAAHTLWLGLAANKAVDELRLHHQLMPDEIFAELNFPKVRSVNSVQFCIFP
jgi:Gamma-glutamyltranspeptidase